MTVRNWAVLSIVAVVTASRAPAAESPARPNILFCVADDASWLHFGAYGCQWVKTPAFDKVAKNGVLFMNTYTPTSKCAPSRASILTGRNPWQLEAAANHMCYFPAKFRTFGEALDANGYFVGQCGKGWGPGVMETADGKKREPLIRVIPGKTRNDHASAFSAFLAQRPKGKPFFFWFGSHQPHRSYPKDEGVKAGKRPEQVDRVPGFWPDNETIRKDMLDYAVEVEKFDTQLGQVLKVLEESGEADNTLVIVTSDNGMPFPRVKGHTYELATHMPMAMAWKNGLKNPGRKAADLVSFIDLAPTFLDVAGVDPAKSGMAPITGKSLTDIIRDDKERNRKFVLVGRERNDWGRPMLQAYPTRGIVEGHHLLLVNMEPDRWPCCNPEADYPDTDASPSKSFIAAARDKPELHKYWNYCFGKRPAEEFFDLTSDPDCIKNLAADPAAKERKDQMRKRLFDLLKAQQDPRVLGNGEVFDRYPPSNKEWIGKFEREIAPKIKP